MQNFIFQGIRRWPVTSLLPLMQRYSHLILLKTVVGYWELRRFQETQININGLLEKSHIHHISIVELLKRNLMNQVAELFCRFISSISVGSQIFPKITGDKAFL